MTKFNVGDKVIFNKENEHVAKQFDYKINKPYEVQEVFPSHCTVQIINEKGSSHSFDEERFELVETKPTKNQRITALENEVAELKLIVHELRDSRKTMRDVMNEVLSEPSTPTVEDIIEYEGQQYKKVDREAHEGDVIVARVDTSNHVVKDVPYKVTAGEGKSAELGELAYVYYRDKERTPETVDVYELIEGGLNPQIPILDETIEPLTPNQQRAAIIEKAKKFVDEHKSKYRSEWNIVGHTVQILIYDSNGMLMMFRQAKCNPNDVFNEHIGKAIALGRALGLDVREFEQAVQPTVAIGQLLDRKNNKHNHTRWKVDDLNDTGKNLTIIDNEFESLNGETADGGYLPEETWYKIINDTNAKYEVES